MYTAIILAALAGVSLLLLVATTIIPEKIPPVVIAIAIVMTLENGVMAYVAWQEWVAFSVAKAFCLSYAI